MEGTKPDAKKIVLKKRGDAATVKEELVSEQGAVSAPSEEARPEENRLFFEGELFDQFYRPLSVTGGEEVLLRLASEPAGPVKPPVREPLSVREARAAERQAIAEALSHQIYKLAQKDRETNIDVYLAAFNVALAEKSCQESRDILVRANEFFSEHYYAPIRERGERPEIFNQIVKRVGHQHAERLRRIVFGLDVEAIANRLWEIFHSASTDKRSRISDILLECTEFQVRALREEFMRLPYKDVARQLFGILAPTAAEAPTGARKTIGRAEVVEHKRQAAFRMRDQMRGLRSILLGRGVEEISLVKKFYLELGDQSLPDRDLSLEASVRRRFSAGEVERLGSLLTGWTPHHEATEINEILFGSSVEGRPDDTLSDPRDVVDREYTPGLGPLLQRFKKSRLRVSGGSVGHHIFAHYELVRERVAALSPSKFLATNGAMNELFGYELDATFFPSLVTFDPRQTAILMNERLKASFDLHEALQPMEFMSPRQCLAVQRTYETLFGATLRDNLVSRIREVGLVISVSDFNAITARLLDGNGRSPLDVDLLAICSGRDAEKGAGRFDIQWTEADEEVAIRLGSLIDPEAPVGTLDRGIQEILIGLSLSDLHRVEHAFYELTDPRTPLVQALKEVMSPDAFDGVRLLLAGIDLSNLLKDLNESPICALSLKGLPADLIGCIRDRYKAIYFTDLVEHTKKFESRVAERDVILEALGVLLKPEIMNARAFLGTVRREVPLEVDLLRSLCLGDDLTVMGFERGYDILFPRLRVHLKLAAARMALSVSTFSELLLGLEGVNPEIVNWILECFDSVDINRLLELLRTHKGPQRLIEECYDLLYPDRTLRHALKEMAVDIDQINEALLHLEGFCSKTVALEVVDLARALSGDELGQALIAILTPSSENYVNKRIPQDINWLDEMCCQIGLAYKRLTGELLVITCRQRGVSAPLLEEITSRIYGVEVCSASRELFQIIKASRDGTAAPDGLEARVCGLLESRGQKFRERVMASYQSLWAHTAGFSGLLDDLTRFVNESQAKRRLLALFLGRGSDRRGGASTLPEMH